MTDKREAQTKCFRNPGRGRASARRGDIEEAALMNRWNFNKQTWNTFTQTLSHRTKQLRRRGTRQWPWCPGRLSDLNTARRDQGLLCSCGNEGLDERHVTVESRPSAFLASLGQERAKRWCLGCDTALRTRSPIRRKIGKKDYIFIC